MESIGVLIVFLLLGGALIFASRISADGDGEPSGEDMNRAALRDLTRRIPRIYSAIGSPPADCDAAQEAIDRIRKEVEAMPNARWRRAYTFWLNHYAGVVRVSRRAWERERRIDRAYDNRPKF